MSDVVEEGTMVVEEVGDMAVAEDDDREAHAHVLDHRTGGDFFYIENE